MVRLTYKFGHVTRLTYGLIGIFSEYAYVCVHVCYFDVNKKAENRKLLMS